MISISLDTAVILLRLVAVDMSFRVEESGTYSFTAGFRTKERLLLSVQNVALTCDISPCVLTITYLTLKETNFGR